jgi:hypothetical protein
MPGHERASAGCVPISYGPVLELPLLLRQVCANMSHNHTLCAGEAVASSQVCIHNSQRGRHPRYRENVSFERSR